MNKVEEIFKAWNIAFNPDDQQAELASKRIEICNSCEHKVTNLGINRCSVCGCALKGKVFTPVKGACPKGKWDEIDQVMVKDIEITPEDTIFVQIASYRDPELKNTLKDLLEKAHSPENLRICLAWQHSEEDSWDNLDEYLNDSRFTIIDIPYNQSQGACWARNTIQQKYNGEKYTLQLDSHHRFVQDWDRECIKMILQLQKKGHNKPLLTSYIPSYNPENDPQERVQEPWRMNFDRFIPEGPVFFLPGSIPGWQNMTEPVPARFYSAHFCFTLGSFALEVQHDPRYYFHGEEITIGVRAYTHGYDLFHPHKILVWHEYTRKGRTKQWDDDPTWSTRNKNTHSLVRKLLGIDGETWENEYLGEFSKYSLGTTRSLQEYEQYSGVRFKNRSIQQWTLDLNNPPNPDPNAEYFTRFKHCIDLHRKSLTETDYEFWAVIFEKEDGSVIYRKDCDSKEVERLLRGTQEWINLWREYDGEQPYKWIVWPYSTSKGWCNRIEGKLKNG